MIAHLYTLYIIQHIQHARMTALTHAYGHIVACNGLAASWNAYPIDYHKRQLWEVYNTYV